MQVQNLTPKIIHDVVSLLKLYKEMKADTPSEFLEEHASLFISKKTEPDNDNELETLSEFFLGVAKHEKYLEKFIMLYYKKIKRIIQTDKYILMVLCYIIVTFTTSEQLTAVADILVATSYHKACILASFLGAEAGILLLTQAATYFYEIDYVKNVVIREVLKDSNIYQKLYTFLLKSRVEAPKEKFTKPQHMNVLNHANKTSTKQLNNSTDEKRDSIMINSDNGYIPQSTEAQIMAPQIAPPGLPKKPASPPAEEPTVPLLKAKPLPNFKEPDVPVKMNTTTVLRQALKIVKDEEEEMKRVKNLTSGALDYTQFEKLFVEWQNKEEQEYLKSIEKKHLKGLSTYEEAILAKRNYLQKNKEKRALYEEQKKELENKLREYRQAEEEKIRQIIQKTQEVQKHVEERKRDLLSKKQKMAKEINDESRSIMLELFNKRTEELNRKIELINEIRTLNTFRVAKKEFDETETMNIGLLCEMSIAELNERLTMVRAEMKEELEMRRKRIKDEKVRQQELLKEMQNLIETNQIQRKRINIPKQKINLQVQPDEEILALRKKLEEAREKRKAGSC